MTPVHKKIKLDINNLSLHFQRTGHGVPRVMWPNEWLLVSLATEGTDLYTYRLLKGLQGAGLAQW